MERCTLVEMYEFVGQACANAGLLGSMALVMIILHRAEKRMRNEMMEICDVPPIGLSAG